ncbi:MAG TPA: hypothetical protein VFX52_00810 [Nocardioidaceae bacterium]|nr:hypothetical protein [Nocardioidaceae bacterium]
MPATVETRCVSGSMRRMALFFASATYTVPRESTCSRWGELNWAAAAGPLTYPAAPVPA